MPSQPQSTPGNHPGQGGGENQPGRQGNGNEGPSRPKNPDNDPDQTPDREVKNPPQADPSKENDSKGGKQPYK